MIILYIVGIIFIIVIAIIIVAVFYELIMDVWESFKKGEYIFVLFAISILLLLIELLCSIGI